MLFSLQLCWEDRADLFVQSPEFSGPWVIDHMDEDRLDLSDITSVVGNMKALAPQWQALLDTDGSLRFYVDQV